MDKNKWFKLWHILDKLTGIEDEISLFKESIHLLKKEFNDIEADFYEISTIRNHSYKKAIPSVTFIKNALDSESNPSLITKYPDLDKCYSTKKPLITESQDENQTVFIYPLMAQKDVHFIFKAVFPNFFDHTDPVLQYFFSILFNFYSSLRSNERDFLTGLYNRRAFDRVTSSLEKQYKKDNLNDYLIIIDIDFFKKINDQYGHMIGDEVLILFSRILVDNTRLQDSVFRMGGEEFVILATQLTVEDAFRTCERLRENIQKTSFPQAGGLTISIGFARIDYPVDIYQVLKKADRALYYAKEHGRNIVCSYESLVNEKKIKPVSKSSDLIDIW